MSGKSDTIADLLQRERTGNLDPVARNRLRRARRFPWCQIPDSSSDDRQNPPPFLPEPGMTLLVAVDADQSHLYAAHHGKRRNESSPLPLSTSLQELVQCIWHTVDFFLPLSAVLPSHPQLQVESVWGAPAPLLDGDSFGLALALGTVSQRLNLPLPADLCALATVDEKGRTGPVNAFESKLDGIAANAPAVCRVLVSSQQLPAFENWLSSAPRRLDAIPVDSLQKAIAIAFPDPFTPLQSFWESNPAQARRQLRHLFEACLTRKNLFLEWSQVARTAEILMEIPAIANHPEEEERAHFVRQVARRHAGDENCILPWLHHPMKLPRPIRLQWMSHTLQSIADSHLEYPEYKKSLQMHIRKAERHLASPRESSECDWILRGAMGRAWAACHEFEAAERLLSQTVAGWFSLLREPDASIPLCEWLRVLALLKRKAKLFTAIDCFAEKIILHPNTSPVSCAYLHLACGRALCLVNEHHLALDWFDSPRVAWAVSPLEVQASRLRWKARAAEAASLPDTARAARHELDVLGSLEHDIINVMHLLARLDAALHAGSQPIPGQSSASSRQGARRQNGESPDILLDALSASSQGAEIQRQLAYARLHSLPPASTLAIHYRY